jgi:hypothetical protein
VRKAILRFSLVVAFAFAGLIWGQSTAVISGTVQDASGAMVPGAAVAAVQQQTDEHFSAASDEQGRFSFPRLPVGNYKISVTHAGFRRFESESIRLDADQTRQANIVLQLGETNESVQVTGAISLVETIGCSFWSPAPPRAPRRTPTWGRTRPCPSTARAASPTIICSMAATTTIRSLIRPRSRPTLTRWKSSAS